MGVVEIIAGFIKILASPGGQDALARLFNENGITVDKVVATLASLPPPVDLPGDHA